MQHRLVALAAAALLVGPFMVPTPAQSQQQGQTTGSLVRQRDTSPPRPVPRRPDGRPLLGGATPTQRGLWLPGNGGFTNPANQPEVVPFQPWAEALYKYRGINQFEPHTRCKPSGATRQFLTPYGVEFVEFPEIQRIYIFDVGGPHTYRTVYMDGRTHPEQLTPSYYGHSIGWWDGDTLSIDTVGFNESFWIDRNGLPHTSQMHTLETFTRVDFATIKYEVTFDDPGAYTRPWSGRFDLRWEADTELFEYVCQQANIAGELMVGGLESVDRRSLIVP